MNPPFMRPEVRNGQRAAALVTTLAIIVIITIVVVAMLTALRVDRVASSSHLERARAELLARDAIEEAVAKLHASTAFEDVNWISQPGRLLARAPGSHDLGNGVVHYLFTTPDGAAPEDRTAGARLNLRRFGLAPGAGSGPDYLIDNRLQADGDAAPMVVAWKYVFRDGTTSFDPDQGEPVGRYAFWADDESARLNLNIAGGREIAAAAGRDPSHQSNLELAAAGLSGDAVDALVWEREQSGRPPYQSPRDAFRSDANGVASAVRENPFLFTHYNHDPETTFFNEPRIVLTTQAARAPRNPDGTLAVDDEGRPYFLDFLATPNSDPGRRANVDSAKFSRTVVHLMDFMRRDDWPMVDGNASIQDKYYAGNPDRLAQLALNIIEYVRSAESAHPVVEPVRVTINTNATGPDDLIINDIQNPGIAGPEGAFKGIARGLHITEQSFTYDPGTRVTIGGVEYFRCRFYVEVHLSPNGGIEQFDLLNPRPYAGDQTARRTFLHLLPLQRRHGPAADRIPRNATYPVSTTYHRGTPQKSDTPTTMEALPLNNTVFHRVDAADILDGGGAVASSVMNAGDHRVIEKDFWVRADQLGNFESGRHLYLRSAIIFHTSTAASLSGAQAPVADFPRMVLAPLSGAFGGPTPWPEPLWFTLGGPSANFQGAQSLQTDDARTDAVPRDWRQAANTFGSANSAVSTVGGSPLNVFPPQDSDGDGNISDASQRMPFPRGHPRNPAGAVYSAGELGFVHTGLEGSSTAPTGSVPWRTIRLQPTPGQDNTVVPDWAFMDLFTVPGALVQAPTEALEAFYSPHQIGIGGRINLNSRIHPFEDAIPRLEPLAAVFLNASHDVRNPSLRLDAAQAEAIAANIQNHTLSTRGGTSYGMDGVYESPGSIVEIAGVADQIGEAGEELIRQVSNLLTTRGSVFSVYAVGQSIRRTPSGEITVMGERRFHTMIERYIIPDPLDHSIRRTGIRSAFFQDLAP